VRLSQETTNESTVIDSLADMMRLHGNVAGRQFHFRSLVRCHIRSRRSGVDCVFDS